MTVESLITQHIDTWTSTVKTKSASGRGSRKKLELYGVKKLRELILELAVRGKLVPQDLNDEPASVLLERIVAEKTQLVKDKKIKNPKALSQICDDKPFPIPNSWIWSQLGFLTNYGVCDKAEPKDVATSTWVLELEDVEKSTSKLLKKVNFEGRAFKSSKNRFLKNDVIYGKLRPYLDKVLVADEDGVCTTEMIPIRGYNEDIVSEFLRLVLKTPYFIQYANSSTHGMNLPRMGTEKARDALIPLVPINEQHRIVAKVDELMSLCDQLEQQTEASIEAHELLVSTLLNTLTNSADADELMENWVRISDHFDTLFTTEESIDQLKQTILQLAVMGKLVPQDPNDEPASVLLERIAEEKTQLIKDKKIKKQKELPPIADDEKPFELPNGWEWCRFGTLVNFKAELVRPEEYLDLDQVAPDSIEKGTGKLIKRRTVAESGVKGPNSRFYAGQVLYSKIRPSLSKAIIAEFDGLCSADMYPLEAMVNSEFLLKIILSEVFLTQVRAAENRIKMPKLNVDSLSNILVPICPDNEMGRIISKLFELLFVSDQLKQHINKSHQTQIQLTDAIVEQAI
ncbi:restriction endonuclease subunit S [Photobacterium carnosum]|uniref:restriction endonuclease subunit S n=1 Tax=Photobacterium carnosum TaxID=2023717 RepID=UPI001E3D9921|nr:restriction endonuclease subunit S [Photobacterium carnosum]MCD9525630.1 restriction endonuclease subunit S [Photobacterium carnosum]